jgi:hypothetical protein
VSTPLLIGLIWLGLVVMFVGVLRVGTSAPTPRPSVSPPLAVNSPPLGATGQRTRPEASGAAIATRVEAA